MQLRCTFCHLPFAITREGVYNALEEIHAKELSHFNLSCPHCRKINRIPKNQLLRAAPGWQPGQLSETQG
jgi:phage FluMu protein Com